MAVEVLYDPETQLSVCYCNTSMTSFGPAMRMDKEATEEFVDYVQNRLHMDPRTMNPEIFSGLYQEWVNDSLQIIALNKACP